MYANDHGHRHRKGGKTLAQERRTKIVQAMRAASIIAIGLATGILSGLLGVGGGFIMVPAMVYLLGMSQHQAHGTSLAAMIFIVLLSAISYSVNGYMNWAVAIELAIGGVLGAMVGARICNRIGAKHLRRYFGMLLIMVAAKMIWDVASSTSGGGSVNGDIKPHELHGIVVFGIGTLTGILSGLMGVGGGIIMVPAMVYLMGFSQKMAQGVSLAVIIPVSISGALIHAKQGNVRSDVGYWLVIGGVLGGLVGAQLAQILPNSALKAVFGLLMVVLGSMMAAGRKQARQTIDNADDG